MEVGKAFGVVQVLDGDLQYDVATFRADGSYSDGRRPDDVRWATARDDVHRRDFTINGLLYDPLGEKLLDLVGGEADLRAGLIRAIGDPNVRFEEDALRLLRAVRFSARFGFRIEPDTWSALRASVPTIARVSPERIRYELERILCEGRGRHGLTMLHELGLWYYLLNDFTFSEAVIQRFPEAVRFEPVEAWAALCIDQLMNAPELREFGKRMRMSRALIDRIVETVGCARNVARYATLEIAARKRLVRNRSFDAAIRILLANPSRSATVDRALRERDSWSRDQLHPPALLTGSDLCREGYNPGPRFGQVLRELEDLQLAGQLETREEALAYVKRRLDAHA